MKIVSETPEEQVRQRRLEEDLRLSFAEAAAAMLEFIADGSPEGDMIDLMRKFVLMHDDVEKISIDPKGVPISMPAIAREADPSKDPDDAINTILRGALRVAAARLLHKGATTSDSYKNAIAELSEGAVLLQRKTSGLKQRKP